MSFTQFRGYITKVVPKRHALYHACVNDLRMVYRSPGDLGKKRTATTPNISQLTRKTKWCNAEYNGQKVLNEKQIMPVKSHIQRGCLSGIEPGGGTNYNEALHCCIFSHAGRIGIPLAYALLTVLLFTHNSKREMSTTFLTKSILANMANGREKTMCSPPLVLLVVAVKRNK